MPSTARSSLLGIILVIGLLLAACGGNDGNGPEETGASAEPPDTAEAPEGESDDDGAPAEAADDRPLPDELEGELPPVDPLALEPLYGDALAALGVELTDRGGLIDRSDGYEVSEDGTHLALYVAPIGDRSDDEYVDGIVELAQLFLPEVFERWPGLETFDVCQELPEDEETGHVSTVTQIDLARDVARTIDWATVDLVDLLQVDRTSETFALRIYGDLARHDRVAAAQDEAISRIDEQLHPDG